MGVRIGGIDVRRHYELMPSPSPAHRQFISYIKSLLRANFARFEALPDMVADNVALTLVTTRALLIQLL